MIRYQGESIDFSIEIEKIQSTDVQDWSVFTDVVVYLYTQTSYIAKFKNTPKDGYDTITLSNNKKFYTGILSSQDTKPMSGALLLDIYVYSSDGSYKCIKSVTTGIEIRYTPIKQEA